MVFGESTERQCYRENAVGEHLAQAYHRRSHGHCVRRGFQACSGTAQFPCRHDGRAPCGAVWRRHRHFSHLGQRTAQPKGCS